MGEICTKWYLHYIVNGRNMPLWSLKHISLTGEICNIWYFYDIINGRRMSLDCDSTHLQWGKYVPFLIFPIAYWSTNHKGRKTSYCSLKVICNWEKYVSFKKQTILMFKGEICLWINICGENVSLEKLLMGKLCPWRNF